MRDWYEDDLPEESERPYVSGRSQKGKSGRRKRSEKRKESLKEAIDTLIYILVVVVLTFLFIQYVAQVTRVEGSSMEATLHDKDSLMIDKISYRFQDPQRFDIIVFPYAYGEKRGEKTYYIKRIIGLPGETISIDLSGVIYVDGQPLQESYGYEVIRDPGIALVPIELGEDEYFVLGDNRNNSKDSRFLDVGNIHREDIIGKTFVRIFPIDSFGLLKHQ